MAGCPRCYGTYTPTTEEFVENAKKIHGSTYNYSKVVYKNNNTKVGIYCNKCEKYFLQVPSGHLMEKMGVQYVNVLWHKKTN